MHATDFVVARNDLQQCKLIETQLPDADALPTDRELTIVTHSVSIALTLSARPNLTVMLVGGRLRSRTL